MRLDVEISTPMSWGEHDRVLRARHSRRIFAPVCNANDTYVGKAACGVWVTTDALCRIDVVVIAALDGSRADLVLVRIKQGKPAPCEKAPAGPTSTADACCRGRDQGFD